MRFFLLSLAVLISTTSCTRHGEWLVKADKGRSPEGESFEPPFVARFKKDDHMIFYIVSKHLSIQTRETVRQTLAKYNPESLVIDGVEAFKGELPQSVQSKVIACEQIAYKGPTCGETAYALRQALARKMTIYTGEPTDQELREFLLKAGYQDLDIIAFFIHRQIIKWKKQGINDEKKLDTNVETQLVRWSREFELKEPWSMAKFMKWRNEIGGLRLSLRETTQADISPTDSENATFIQKMATEAEILNDRKIVQAIQQAAATSKSIIVVLDAPHYYNQLDSLIDLFGAPLEYKL